MVGMGRSQPYGSLNKYCLSGRIVHFIVLHATWYIWGLVYRDSIRDDGKIITKLRFIYLGQ